MDEENKVWEPLDETITAGNGHNIFQDSCVVNLLNGNLLAVGGYGTGSVIERTVGGVWEVNTWEDLSSTAGRRGHGCILISNDTKLLVTGGNNDNYEYNGYSNDYPDTSNTLIIDLASKNNYQYVTSLNYEREGLVMALINGKPTAIGGSGYVDDWNSSDYNVLTPWSPMMLMRTVGMNWI